MRDIELRQAVPEDAEQVIDLLTEIMRHHEVRPPGHEEMAKIVQSIMAAPTHTFLVADHEGRLVGLCALVFSLSTWRAVRVCELQDVVVSEEARGQGVGRRLLEGALDLARGRGCAWVYLTAESWNLTAHDFYRSLGFREKAVLYFEHDLGVGSKDVVTAPGT